VGEPETIPLPVDGTIAAWSNEPGRAEVFLQLTSWAVSPRVYRCDVETKRLEDTGWIPPSPIDFSQIESHEVDAPSKDGTLVPLSIIHKKGLELDGNNPTILLAYGSYGIVVSPRFLPELLAWYERGGVFAVGHLRGGGEYGKEWHEAGKKLNKENTINDFIACAQWLIEQEYTRPERLAGEGGSAGGIPTGGALVRRPDLWAAMVMQVPVANALRFEFSENGPPNIPEFGSVTTEEGFRALQIIDSYSKVRDGVEYPAVLLTTGLNDKRVDPWEAMKMAARLQAATASGKPVLLRVETQAGHGFGSTRKQEDELLADVLAFLLHQLHTEPAAQLVPSLTKV
jgi:prolyl oligopeptidase